MKQLSEKVVKGKRRVTVELEEGEKLIALNDNKLYMLGEPWEDQVLYGHTLLDAVEVTWCSVEQKMRML